MEARYLCKYTYALLLSFSFLLATGTLFGQTYQSSSENFVVYAANAQLAKKASVLAEQYRKDLSLDWLGYEIEPWRERCPIYIEVGHHAGGETSFAFIQGATGRSEPISWQMKIYGPIDRLLDAVLPHEVTHTIFATHFGRPLPRWADEGACTTVEHESERAKNHQMLISFLTARPSRGIPFNRMFTMKQYPHDILPLYAQGYSVARYLIGQKGRQHFVQYLEKGMTMERSNRDTGAWDRATKEYYGFENLSDLQISWEKWVRSGSPQQTPDLQIASSESNSQSGLIDPKGTYAIAKNSSPIQNPIADNVSRTDLAAAGKTGGKLNSWYARESRAKQAVSVGSKTVPNPASAKNNSTPFRPGSLKRDGASAGTISSLMTRSDDKPASTLWR